MTGHHCTVCFQPPEVHETLDPPGLPLCCEGCDCGVTEREDA